MTKSIITLRTRRFWEVDPRIKFLIGSFGSLFIIFIQNEMALLAAFAIALCWCTYCGKWKNALVFGVLFGLLQYWAYWMLSQETVSGLITSAVMLRRFMLIGAFTVPLASVEIGELVGSMYKLKLPRFVIITMAIMFRFIPTIREEYRAVRTSQKFRGIGRSIINVIFHPVIFYETLLVPLTIRIMKISDELSASAMLRGADRKGNGTCFRNVKITFSDFILFMIISLAMVACLLINYDIILLEVSL